MDVFTGGWTGSSGSGLGIDETSVQIGYGNRLGGSGYATEIVIATASDAIATVTIGAVGDWPSQTCTFMWQAHEVPTGDSSPPGTPIPTPGGSAGGGVSPGR